MANDSITIGHSARVMTLTRARSGSDGFGGHEPWSLTVELEQEGLRSSAEVWLGPVPPLSNLFDDMAANWRGWNGPKVWDSGEGGLTLACLHDGLGHVSIKAELRQHSGSGWVVQTTIPVDAGQLDALAADVRRLLAD
jgi:hypothetical protein